MLKKKKYLLLEEGQQVAQAEADKFEALAQKLYSQHQTNVEEIERLNAESNLVLQSGLGQKEADIGGWMAKTFEEDHGKKARGPAPEVEEAVGRTPAHVGGSSSSGRQPGGSSSS